MARRLYKSKAQKRPKKPSEENNGWFNRLTRRIAPYKKKLAIWAVALGVIGASLGIFLKVTDVGNRIANYLRAQHQTKIDYDVQAREALYAVIRASAAPELKEIGHFQIDEDFSRAANARQLLYTLESRFPGHPDIELGKAAVAGAEGNDSLALEHARKYLDFDRSDSSRWSLFAQIHSELGDWREASAAFEEAIRLGESSASVFRSYGYVALREEKYKLALDLCRKAQQRNPHDARNDAFLALSLYRNNYRFQALERASLILKDENRSHVVSFQITCILLSEERYAEAKAEFERIIRSNQRPGSSVYHGYGIALLGCNQVAEAVGYLEKALEMRPGNAYIEDALLYAYRQKRSSEGKLEVLPPFPTFWR